MHDVIARTGAVEIVVFSVKMRRQSEWGEVKRYVPFEAGCRR